MMKLIFGILACAFMLGACNTMEGFGEDVESAANAVDNAT